MDSFNKLSIEEQIEYINAELKQGKTLTGIAKALGIGRTTISDRARKAEYKYNKDLNKYVQLQKQDENNNYKNNENVIEPTKQIVNIDTNKENTHYNDMIKVIKGMETKLDEVYGWYNKQKNCIEPIELKINKFEGEALNRTFKVYPDILDDLKEFCGEHKVYKVQDIISQAFLEFMQKYR